MSMTRTSSFLVPFALCAMGACVLVLAGCRKEEEQRPVDPSSPESYVHDQAFMGGLKAARAKQGALIRERNVIAEKMKAMIEAKKAELKTDDLEKVKAVLDRDPAWQALYVQCTNANESVRRHRRETLGVVRGRIAPRQAPAAKEISK